ncbi:Cof-type HAD-IIB family hydrolase [Kurthia zopfii]|uniref:Cof-type HAD-IIB family hydrolase n=1 Tax=Kurthia zopfii TaxID=1650 RepID=UPI000F6F9B5D|nr:Cof-type HAD-IIB family hydrolase [Kurthia zopfii]VEI04843.1 Putative bifunctional phosphatase/peptidyl-prolyl cis-trans isomerase [Kurthia zopfii]
MNKKLLFFDIDGTLYNSSKKVPEATMKAINEARERGHEIAIATGRSPFFLKEVSDELNVDSFVSFNGQFVVYKGEPISKRPIPQEVLAKLSAAAAEEQYPTVYLDQFRMTSTTEHHDQVKESLDSLYYPMPEYDVDHYKNTDVYQALLYVIPEKQAEYETNFPELAFIRWHKFSADVINHDVSKAYGIEQFIKQTDFSIEDVIVFGDGLNDVEMLEFVAGKGVSVAMGNGVEEAKQAATFVTDHVDEDGLSKAMRKLGLCD